MAYLVNQYPKVSHSFIRREIQALERQGVNVLRWALRGWDAELVDAEDVAERSHTRYVLRGGVRALAGAALRTAIAAPAIFMHALGSALRLGWKAALAGASDLPCRGLRAVVLGP